MASFEIAGRSIDINKFQSIPVLLAIFLIGFAIRYTTKHELLFDPDSYVWYQIAMYYAGIKADYIASVNGELVQILRYYPTGHPLGADFPLLPYSIGISYKLLGAVGLPQTSEGLLQYMFFIGAFYGALTAVVAFFLAKELTGSPKAGFIASVMYAFSHFAMTRNTAGDTGQESLGTLLLFAMLYLFIKAVNQKEIKWQVGYGVASGIVFILAGTTWGGAQFYWGMISSTVLGYLLINIVLDKNFEEYRDPCIVFPMFFITIAIIPAVLNYTRVFGEFLGISVFQILSYIVVFISVVLLSYNELRKRKGFTYKEREVLLGGIAIAVLALAAIGRLDDLREIIGWINKIILRPEVKDVTGSTVAYYRETDFNQFKSTFDTLLLLIPIGSAILLHNFYRRRDFNSLFLIVFMILGVLGFRYMIRLSFFLALILPLYLGFIFSWLYAKKSEKETGETGPPRPNATVAIGLMVVVLFFIAPVLAGSVQTIPRSKYADQGVIPWRDVGTWLKDNTPDDALLIHWWDYGYHLQTFAERTTIVDGGNAGKPLTIHGNRNIDVAMAFTSTEDEFTTLMSTYNPDDRPVYVLVSIEEFGKSGAINYHAESTLDGGDPTKEGGQLYITSFTVPNTGNPSADQQSIMNTLQSNAISTYYIMNYGSYYQVWAQMLNDASGGIHPEWADKLLAKLLPFNTGYGQGLEHFQLVHQNGYVYVYKYIP